MQKNETDLIVKTALFWFDILMIFFLIMGIIVFINMVIPISKPAYQYKDKVIVTDGFFKGQHGYVSSIKDGFTNEYAVKTEKDILLFIKEHQLKREGQ